MKKLFISAAAIMAALAMNAQVIDTESPVAVAGLNATEVAFSADGTALVAVTAQGIEKVDVATGQRNLVVKGSGMYKPALSADGSKVVYMQQSFKDKLRYVSLQSTDVASGQSNTIVKPSRKLNHGYAIEGSTVNAVNNGKRQVKALEGKATNTVVASINYGHLDVTDAQGKTRSIDPQGRGSYLWPSVSPDGTRICYWLSGVGCFTCNPDGSDVKAHGRLMDAKWLNNNVLVGMTQKDDAEGRTIETSTLHALDVNNGEHTQLTADGVFAAAPAVSANGQAIAFIDGEGQVFVINVK